jgi:hypothetical protein
MSNETKGLKSKLERLMRENDELKLMWNHESLKYHHDNENLKEKI